MKSLTKHATAVAALAGALALGASAAQAAPTYSAGSFAFGLATSTTSDVTTTTTFDTSGDMRTLSASGDMGLVTLPDPLPIDNPTVDFTTGSGLGFSDAAFGTFAPTSSMLVSTSDTGSGASESASATWYVSGNFTLGNDWANTGTTLTASETWSLTQTGGPGAAISMSGTFASPALPAPVPEPATLALLGAGLAGFGAMRQRRKKRA